MNKVGWLQGRSPNHLGIAAMVFGVGMFALVDAILKLLVVFMLDTANSK